MKNDVVRSFGHPLHAALVHLPLGLLLMAPIWDVVGLSSNNLVWWQVGFWTTIAGVILAVPIALVGLADLLRATSGASRSTAIQHMLWNLGAVAAFAIALILRGSSIIAPSRETIVLVMDLGGASALGVAGWLGGQLVFHHGIGRTTASAATGAEVQDRSSTSTPSVPHERAA